MKIEEARNLQELFKAVETKFAFDKSKLLVLKIMGLCVAMTEMKCGAEVIPFAFKAWSDGKEGTEEELRKGFSEFMTKVRNEAQKSVEPEKKSEIIVVEK